MNLKERPSVGWQLGFFRGKRPSGGWASGSIRAIGLALLCIACAPRQPDAAGSNGGAPTDATAAQARALPAVRETALHLALDGIELVDRRTGASRHIGFGAAEAAARAAIEPAAGEPGQHFHDPICRLQPNSRLVYDGGLSLYFEGGVLVAWQLDDGSGGNYRLPAIFPGMTRAQLQHVGHVRFDRPDIDTPMMEDFTLGPISGMLLDNKVTNFRAGRVVCE